MSVLQTKTAHAENGRYSLQDMFLPLLKGEENKEKKERKKERERRTKAREKDIKTKKKKKEEFGEFLGAVCTQMQIELRPHSSPICCSPCPVMWEA